ncbi:NADP-dependent oxidoreductase [Enhygromyxa salina]|uniref:Zinc-type alcohol dehydrogenase-like protein n=1 Tax=Enhygromyxa salina TaxID=215803 RepID=A0A2S9XWR7_9BACT|nr:NADP-dependent oxidoreductase [Enhygromyxa salina]PRP97309.1 Zinc-type alcohol dehydrogenase-like protein [Enhygromyxa salina]
MRAQVYSRYGGPEVLELRTDLPEPHPGPTEVLVEVRASSVNPVDWKLRRGNLRKVLRRSFPIVPGRDFCGVVLECGTQATTVARGDEVFGLTPMRGPGSHADRICVPERYLALAPRRLHGFEAAAVPLAGLTAIQASEAAQLSAGQRVLVHGGAGAVGALVVQYLGHLGVAVTATASARNLDYLRSLGADPIDYRSERFEDRVDQLDAVIDCVGGEVERRSFAVLRRGGRLVSVAGPDPDAEVSLVNAVKLGGPTSVRLLGQFARGRRYQFVSARVNHQRLAQLAQIVDAGAIEVRIDHEIGVMGLAQLGEAHTASERGEAQGKLVIDHSRD